MCKREYRNAKSYFTEDNQSVHRIGKDIEQHGHDNHRHSHPEPRPSRSVGRGERRNHLGSHGGVGNQTTLPCSSSKPVEVLPPNYDTCFRMFKLAVKMLLILLGLAYWRITEIIDKKQKHTWAFQIMEELAFHASNWEYDNPQQEISTRINILAAPEIDENPPHTSQSPGWKENKALSLGGTETAAKNGNGGEKMAEILQKILNIFPTKDDEHRRYGKNTVLMEMKNTQPYMYKLVMEMVKENKDDGGRTETPFLVAAKMGVVEMVKKLLEVFPVAIRDVNQDGKNALHLAMENRKHKVFKFMSSNKYFWDHVEDVDNDGNTALHLAVTLGKSQPWLTPSAVLQMQLELKWYKIVSKAMPSYLIARRNHKGLTAKEVFTETHKDMVREGAAQLTSISNSCSVVAALIATVAFATAATIPGGFRTEDGTPTFEGKNAFDIFTGCSLIALCLSIISIITFLAILIYPYQESDFGNYLPKKLLIGFTALLLSIAFIFVSFCASHFFLLRDKLHHAAYPVYATICFSITFFSIFQFPLYFDLIKSTIKSTPPDY